MITPHTPHLFIFTPGKWQGKGSIMLSLSPTALHFTTHWHVHAVKDGSIEAEHLVEIEGAGEPLKNMLRFFDFTKTTFQVELTNDIIGKAIGKGIIDEQTLAWEFRNHTSMDGFELFQRDTAGEGYHVHAEYASPDRTRSVIRAHIRPDGE